MSFSGYLAPNSTQLAARSVRAGPSTRSSSMPTKGYSCILKLAARARANCALSAGESAIFARGHTHRQRVAEARMAEHLTAQCIFTTRSTARAGATTQLSYGSTEKCIGALSVTTTDVFPPTAEHTGDFVVNPALDAQQQHTLG